MLSYSLKIALPKENNPNNAMNNVTIPHNQLYGMPSAAELTASQNHLHPKYVNTTPTTNKFVLLNIGATLLAIIYHLCDCKLGIILYKCFCLN